jgi:hypothetical protein
MADEKANISQDKMPKETGVVAPKPAEQTQPASNNHDHGQPTTPKVASTDIEQKNTLMNLCNL